MAEHHAAPGPYETEYETRPAVAHIFASPELSWTDGNLRLLEAACRAAGVELGAWDEDTLLVLAGLGPARAAAWAGMLARAHAALPRGQRDRPRYSEEGPGMKMDGGGMISGPMNWPPS